MVQHAPSIETHALKRMRARLQLWIPRVSSIHWAERSKSSLHSRSRSQWGQEVPEEGWDGKILWLLDVCNLDLVLAWLMGWLDSQHTCTWMCSQGRRFLNIISCHCSLEGEKQAHSGPRAEKVAQLHPITHFLSLPWCDLSSAVTHVRGLVPFPIARVPHNRVNGCQDSNNNTGTCHCFCLRSSFSETHHGAERRQEVPVWWLLSRGTRFLLCEFSHF